MSMFEYKGYKGYALYDDEEDIYYGRIINIRDMVDFHTKNRDELEKEFYSAVDDYIAFKKERGRYD